MLHMDQQAYGNLSLRSAGKDGKVAHMRCQRPELVKTTWAFATARQKDALLFAALAKATERHMGLFHA